MNREMHLNGEKIIVDVTKKDSQKIAFAWQGKDHSFEIVTRQGKEIILRDQLGHLYRMEVDGGMIVGKGRDALFSTQTQVGQAAKAKGGDLSAPMPGKVFKVLVKVGDSVQVGQTLLILEAMKMEHAIKAGKDGVVKKILFKEGDLVQASMPLAELE